MARWVSVVGTEREDLVSYAGEVAYRDEFSRTLSADAAESARERAESAARERYGSGTLPVAA